MIVVAIIGILAAAAIPQHQNYTKRAKLSEVMSLASGDKTKISEYYATRGEMPAENDTANSVTSPVQLTGDSDSEYATLTYTKSGADSASLVYTIKGVGTGANDKKITFEANAASSSATM